MLNKHCNDRVELLAPALNTNIARSAILSGADAIYIGPPKFGARAAAANTMKEIEELCKFAHQFHAKIFLTTNTLLLDTEIKEAQTLALDAWNAGVDALIVQDMAYLKMNLPPIELHASTQTTNLTTEKVNALHKAGFARVVLERALSLKEIQEISDNTSVELEAFIHGAICVGYSGACTLSGFLANGRGGNRGACAQACRANYDLVDSLGKTIRKNEPILSVQDFALGENIIQMVGAGIHSLKIEGRLKDERYVVNNVAYYNQILTKNNIPRTSLGRSHTEFTPNPLKSFSRSSGVYFFNDKRASVRAATKSLGEPLGEVQQIDNLNITINHSEHKLNNGDGVCWSDEKGRVMGANINGASTHINSVGDDFLLLSNTNGLVTGMKLYRNFDISFKPEIGLKRNIGIKIILNDSEITAEINDSLFVSHPIGRTADKLADKLTDKLMDRFERATNEELSKNNITSILSKSGDTIFNVTDIEIASSYVPFIPNSTLATIRRELLDKLRNVVLSKHSRRERVVVEDIDNERISGSGKLDGLDGLEASNVSNSLSEEFYRSKGYESIKKALEVSGKYDGEQLMVSKYCIRRELGLCGNNNTSLYLTNNGRKVELRFDCKRCEMSLWASR